jgi:hypothetical protein
MPTLDFNQILPGSLTQRADATRVEPVAAHEPLKDFLQQWL